jgi:hypothetical protein
MRNRYNKIYKRVISIILICGILVNLGIGYSILFSGLGIVVIFFYILPSIILQIGLLKYIPQLKFEKIWILVLTSFLVLVSLALPFKFKDFMWRNLNKEFNQITSSKKETFEDFYSKNISSNPSGVYYYPNSEKPMIVVNLEGGKNYEKHTYYDPLTGSLEKVEFFNQGKLDSVNNYFQNKLQRSHYSFNGEEPDSIKQYNYQGDKLINIISYSEKTGFIDTIFVSNSK